MECVATKRGLFRVPGYKGEHQLAHISRIWVSEGWWVSKRNRHIETFKSDNFWLRLFGKATKKPVRRNGWAFFMKPTLYISFNGAEAIGYEFDRYSEAQAEYTRIVSMMK
jgi:hypothetical protein